MRKPWRRHSGSTEHDRIHERIEDTLTLLRMKRITEEEATEHLFEMVIEQELRYDEL